MQLTKDFKEFYERFDIAVEKIRDKYHQGYTDRTKMDFSELGTKGMVSVTFIKWSNCSCCDDQDDGADIPANVIFDHGFYEYCRKADEQNKINLKKAEERKKQEEGKKQEQEKRQLKILQEKYPPDSKNS